MERKSILRRRSRMKVLIIDDHILFAEGMKLLLESFQSDVVTVYAENSEAAFASLEDHTAPDLILLDVNLSGINGFTLIEKFRAINIWAPILVVSATDSVSTAKIAIDKGASGFVSKASDSKTFLQAIETVLYGDVYVPSFSTVATDGSEKSSKTEAKVTSRQHEILYLLSQGMLNKQIANELCISSNTVKAHLHDIFRQLKVTNRTAAVQNAHKFGIL